MESKRYIGIDLHRDCFTACLRLESGREYLKEWKLEDMSKFTAKLRPTDEVAVEVTGNTRLFHDAVAPHVGRVVAVNPSQFKVITHSVKKTDPNDARNLALYLAKDLLPEVRMKDKTQAQIASLTQTRDTMVKLRTALKNKVNNVCSAHGVNLNKESLGSEKGLRAVLEMRFDPLDHRSLNIDTFSPIYVLMGHALPEEAQSRPVQRAGDAQTGVYPQVSNRGETAYPSGSVSFGFAIWPE